MRSPFNKEPEGLSEAIDNVLARMKVVGPDSEDYKTLIQHLDALMKIKNRDKSDRLSKDAMLAGAVGIAQILIIVGYEQNHVLVSKAVSFVKKK